jgi:hypothetical protein
MDEPTTFDLTPEQQNTTALICQLLGQRIADRYVDFCRLSAGAFLLRVSMPVAAHALRELESILRDVLEVPMDVTISPTQEEKDKIEKAKVELKAIGYSDEKIMRAIKELAPRLSHKAQIELIVTRLGLAPDSDIAQSWKAISSAHGKAHGGRALDQTLVVDDTFRAEWQTPFDTVIRGVMIALRGKYAAFMQRAAQLAVMPDRGAAVSIFIKEIPGSLPLLWHFFNQLQTPDWIPHLAKRNLLAAPSNPDDVVTERLLLGQWPAGRYLLRMAQSGDPTAVPGVVAALRNVFASTHADVRQMGLEILAALPATESAPLVGYVEAWLTPEDRIIMAQGPHDLIRKLASGGESEAALRLTRALFKVFDEEGRLGTLFSRHMYEHFLPGAVKALAPVCGVKTVSLLADLLEQAVRISRKVSDDPPHDYTYYVSSEISENGTKHDVIDSLIGETVRAAKLAIETDLACTKDVILAIRSHSPKIFTRMALHVLAFKPGSAPDLAQEYLCESDLLEETWCRIEYGQLAQAWFPSLPEADQQKLLTAVDSAPDTYRDRWKLRFKEHRKRPPTAEDERNYDRSVVRDLVWHWRSVLSDGRRVDVEQLGDPDAWPERVFNSAKSPMTAPDFAARPIDETIAFLETWRPEVTEEKRETITALAQELRNAVNGNPALFSAQAHRFAQLPPIYVRSVLQGLEGAAKNKNSIDWDNALTLIALAATPELQPSPSGLEGDDPDWSWSRKAAAELLASGLRQGAEGIPIIHVETVRSLILELYRAAPRDPDTDNFEESYRSFPHFGAQSTSRGLAVELALLFMYWLSKHPNCEVGKEPQKALEKLPDIQSLFEAELADRTPSGRIPRAIFGRYLGWLYFFAEPWLRKNLQALLPSNDTSLRDAAWLAHLSADRGPINILAAEMRDCYEVEIRRAGVVDSARDRQHVDDRLAEYLIILYIDSALPNEVFELFWNTVPASVRQHAMWFLSTQLELPKEKLPDGLRTRAFSYWDRRLASAKASTNPDSFRQEIGTIGQYFFRAGIDDEWLLDQLLSMSEAGFVPSEAYSVIDRLGKMSAHLPDRAVEVLASLVMTPQFDRWVFMTQTNSIRTILTHGSATDSAQSKEFVSQIISHLSALGDGSYLDLLPG